MNATLVANPASTSAAAPAASVPAQADVNTDRPFTGSIDDLLRRKTELAEEIAMLERAEAQAREAEAARAAAEAQAKREALLAKIRELPSYLGVTTLNEIISLIRAAQNPEVKHRKGTSLSADTKELLRLAMSATPCPTLPELARRFRISTATVSNYKRAFGLTKSTKARKAAKTKVARRASSAIRSPNKTGKTHEPYPPTLRAAVIKAFAKNASVGSVASVCKASPATLQIWKHKAKVKGELPANLEGGVDVTTMPEVLQFLKAAA